MNLGFISRENVSVFFAIARRFLAPFSYSWTKCSQGLSHQILDSCSLFLFYLHLSINCWLQNSRFLGLWMNQNDVCKPASWTENVSFYAYILRENGIRHIRCYAVHSMRCISLPMTCAFLNLALTNTLISSQGLVFPHNIKLIMSP